MFFALSNFLLLTLYQLRSLLTSFYFILYLRRFYDFLKFNIFSIIHLFLFLMMIIIKERFF